jgi:DNA-binding phage protein
MHSCRPHDEAVVELLKADPSFADEYLAAALDEASEPGGHATLLAALVRSMWRIQTAYVRR